MKKYLFIAAAAMGLMFASCKSENVKKAETMLEQVGALAEKGDMEGASKAWTEFNTWYSSLDEAAKKDIGHEDEIKQCSDLMDMAGSLLNLGNEIQGATEELEGASEALDEAAAALDEAAEATEEEVVEE